MQILIAVVLAVTIANTLLNLYALKRLNEIENIINHFATMVGDMWDDLKEYDE